MAVFLGSLGLLLGILLMLAGTITFFRGLPNGITPREGQADPRGNLTYLFTQQALGLGVALLALDVVLRLADRPFFVPGVMCLLVPVVLRAGNLWKMARRQGRRGIGQSMGRGDSDRDS